MADVFNLNPSAHSVGLVKNFSLEITPQFQELTEGIRNSTTQAIPVGADIKASMDVFEHTAANMAYAASLDGGSNESPRAQHTVTAFDPADPTHITVSATGGLSVGKILMVQDSKTPDLVAVAKVTAVNGLILTVDPPISMLDVNGNPIDINDGSVISATNTVFDTIPDLPNFFAAKVVGALANGDIVTILIPKLLITKGLNLLFNQEFSALPIEFSLYELSSSDPNYTWFGTSKVQIYAPQ